MLVARLGSTPGIDNISILTENDLSQPDPGPGEISVRLQASSLNQHDYNVILGRLPAEPGRILLSDAAGTVEAVGAGVTEFCEGDQVISCFFPQWIDGRQGIPGFSTVPGDGVDGYAREHVIRPASWFVRAPRHLNVLESSTLPTAALTAWRALVVENKVKPGDSVLILGTGGVSIFALQFSKMLGARVIATSSSNEKLQRISSLGADDLVNYVEVPEWGQRVRELTDGQGVAHVVEIGGQGTLPQSIEACRVGGRIALIGVLTGIGGYVPLAAMMGKQIRLQGLTVASRSDLQEMISAIEVNKIRPIIDATYSLSNLRDALRQMESGKHFGKIAIDHR